MRNSSAQAWKGFIYYSFSELSHVFATLTYAYIAMYYDMFEGEGIGKGQKVLVGSRKTSTRPQRPHSTTPCPYALGGFDSLWW